MLVWKEGSIPIWIPAQTLRPRTMASITDFLVLSFLRSRSGLNSLLNPSRRPPVEIPEGLLDQFTMKGEVPILRMYLNDTTSKPLKWTTDSRWWNPERVLHKGQSYYKETDLFLYSALEKYPISDKEVVILGSEMPWYECICTTFSAKVTTIEYRPVDCHIPGLTVMTPAEFEANPREFDVAVSISSVEHDGLGRYGDPIDPEGDFKAMEKIRGVLKPGGLLFLSIPVGSDALVWNCHRIYGRKRLPKLIEDWEIVETFGFSEALYDAELGEWEPQPVFVLRRPR